MNFIDCMDLVEYWNTHPTIHTVAKMIAVGFFKWEPPEKVEQIARDSQDLARVLGGQAMSGRKLGNFPSHIRDQILALRQPQPLLTEGQNV